ncbi:hypothetical protein TWF730_007009 [Orbilia blumenaviensis]|uniref:Uncharacterized protein n=1 Tax=Orbilia blumenaviensis TaxID=1796055 RepID=A0AAV9VGB4_9PEZI
MTSKGNLSGPRVVRRGPQGDQNMKIFVSWTPEQDEYEDEDEPPSSSPIPVMCGRYDVLPDAYFAAITYKFEYEAIQLLGEGWTYVYVTKDGRPLDKKKTFRENGILPPSDPEEIIDLEVTVTMIPKVKSAKKV